MTKKGLTVLALLLAALVQSDARAADRTYTLCDPAQAKMCASLVAAYQFQEVANSDRTSETGTAPFLEPSAVDVARFTYATSGDCVPENLHCLNMSAGDYLYIPRSPSLGTSFTANLWMNFSATPNNGVDVLSTKDAGGNQKGSRLYLSVSGSNITPKFEIKQAMTDTVTPVTASSSFTSGSWHLVTFGAYATPTTSEPYQVTLWMQIDAGTKATATATYPPQVFLGDFRLSAAVSNSRYGQFSMFAGTLSAGEVTWLRNSGIGRGYPFTANP